MIIYNQKEGNKNLNKNKKERIKKMLLIKSTYANSEYFLTESVDSFCKKMYENLKEEQAKQGFKPYYGVKSLNSWEDWKRIVFYKYYEILDKNIKKI